jgi:hypothetical protein
MRYLLFFTLLYFAGCISANDCSVRKENYKINIIDYKILDEYCVYLLENSSGNKFILFSDKINETHKNIPFKNYKELKQNTECNINLYMDTNKYILIPRDIKYRIGYPYGIYFENILFMENDTVKAKIYRSKEIFDIYIEISEGN